MTEKKGDYFVYGHGNRIFWTETTRKILVWYFVEQLVGYSHLSSHIAWLSTDANNFQMNLSTDVYIRKEIC